MTEGGHQDEHSIPWIKRQRSTGREPENRRWGGTV